MFKSIYDLIEKMSVRVVTNDDEYFKDSDCLGSTDYSAFQNGEAAYALTKTIVKNKTSAMVLGSLFHGLICGELSLDNFTIHEKTVGTSEALFKSGKIGKEDYVRLQRVLDTFPLDLKKLKSHCELFEREIGYHITIPIGKDDEFKVRIKTDLLFKRNFEENYQVIDWKTSSSDFSYNEINSVDHQANYYLFWLYLILLKKGETVSEILFMNWHVNLSTFRHRCRKIRVFKEEDLKEYMKHFVDVCIRMKTIKEDTSKSFNQYVEIIPDELYSYLYQI